MERRPGRDARRARGGARDLVLETITEHAVALLRVARRYSLCADDAHDAYQRALEIFIRRADSLDPETAVAWLRVVVKHEAFAVRRARLEVLSGEDVDLDLRAASDQPTPDERVERFDRLTRSAEALQRLKPNEVRALALKAQGHSYREIADITGWTYTKVNRCITEGRRSFLDRYAGIEAGRECERWAPVLSAIADGEATAKQLADARPHLRNCTACRAAVREYGRSSRHVAAVVPLAAVALPHGGGGAQGLLARVHDAIVAGVHERLAASAQKAQAALDVAASGKVAAVAASAAAIAGGGVAAVDQAIDRPNETARARVVRATAHAAAPGAAAPASALSIAPRPGAESGSGAAAPDPAPAAQDEFAFEGGEPPSRPPAARTAADTAQPSPMTTTQPRPGPAGAPASAGGGGEFGP